MPSCVLFLSSLPFSSLSTPKDKQIIWLSLAAAADVLIATALVVQLFLIRRTSSCPAFFHLVTYFTVKKRIDQAVSTVTESTLKRLTRQGPSSFLPSHN